MPKQIITFFLLIILGLPNIVQAQSLDLQQSISLALKNNLLLKQKLDQIKAAEQGIKESKAQFFPKFETSYTYTRLKDEPYVIFKEMPAQPHFVTSPENNYTWDIQLEQPIFTGFYLSSQYQLSKLGLNLARFQMIEAKQEIIKEVKAGYFQVLLAKKYQEVAETEVKNLSVHLKDAQALFHNGIIPRNDLLKSEVALANAKQNLVRAKNQVQIAIAAFNTLLQLDVNQPTSLKDILFYKPITLGLDKAYQLALSHRPEIKEIKTQLAQMDAQIKMAKSQYYPQIALVGKYERIGNHPNVNGNGYQIPDNLYLTLQAKWTFFEWGRTKSLVKKLCWQKEGLKKYLKWTKDQIRLQVKQAYLNLKEAEKNIETAKVSVAQAKENYRITDLQYKNQVTTSTEVLDAQTLLTQAQTNYYTALYKYNVAVAELERAIGASINVQ